MTQIASISEFLLEAGTQYVVFDLGRGIHMLEQQQLLDMENGAIPCPRPRAGCCWLGLLFWNKTLSTQHYIWFVKLPLDERCTLQTAARDHFLQLVVDALSNAAEKDAEPQYELPDNPYSFTPSQTQLANFNAISRHQLQLPASEYFADASAYLQAPAAQEWQQIGRQGIADVCARMDDSIQQQLAANLLQFPPAVRETLLTDLQHHPLSHSLIDAIINLAKREPTALPFCLLALGESTGEHIDTLLNTVMDAANSPTADTISVIAGRHWHRFANAERLTIFFERLVVIDGAFFASVFSDWVQIPALRHHCLMLLRSADKSAALTAAVGQLFSEAKV